MLLEILLTLLIILVIGGLFYIIQIQKDVLSNTLRQVQQQNTNNLSANSHVVPLPLPTDDGMQHPQSPIIRNDLLQYKSTPVSNNSPIHLSDGDNEIPEGSTNVRNSSEPEVHQNNGGTSMRKLGRVVFEYVKEGLTPKWLIPKTEGLNPSIVKEKMQNNLLKHSELHECIGNVKVYKLILDEVCKDKQNRLMKFEFGKWSGMKKSSNKEKVIMLVGATGSGKTTLINSMINYMFGVEYEDECRFKLVTQDDEGNKTQAHSQTSWITAYTIHYQKGFKFDYTLTIVDTPGFGDTRGIDRDAEITKQIFRFFMASGKQGIDHIDVVGFVAQSSLLRLTGTQKYIFDQILSLFGKDIGQNIYLMLTFADGKLPQVLIGMNEAQIPYQEYFKFNNSVVFDDNLSADEFCKMFWKMGMGSFGEFFNQFSKISSKTLKQTEAVINERERIETQIEGLQIEVKRGLSKLEQLRTEVQVVLDHESDIARNQDFTYEVIEDTIVKHDLEPNTYVTNCLICNVSCHKPCAYSNDDDKYRCSAMDGGGIENAKCKVCMKGCNWKQHKNMQYYFTTKTTTVTKTSNDLKQRYQDANGKVQSAQQLVNGIVDEFEAVQIKIIGITDVLRRSIEKLNTIALKPISLSTSEYITILIQSERTAAEPGWQDRVQNLIEVRERVDSLSKIAKEGYDPFEGFKRRIAEERQNKQGVWYAVGTYLEKIQFWSC